MNDCYCPFCGEILLFHSQHRTYYCSIKQDGITVRDKLLTNFLAPSHYFSVDNDWTFVHDKIYVVYSGNQLSINYLNKSSYQKPTVIKNIDELSQFLPANIINKIEIILNFS